MRLPHAVILLLSAASSLAVEAAREPFEVAALVDSFDFARIVEGRGYRFDTETSAGNISVLDHVLETGANTILWRNCSGATMRYQSKEESLSRVEAPLDKRRLPDNRPVHGWLRYYEVNPDILRLIFGVCHDRGLRAGVHWPFEETHWASWTFGSWNLEHPQYWAHTRDGRVWAGRCSLAYPEVVSHKLRLVDELLARGMDHLFIDTWRNGGWGPAFEYVPTELARWRARHGTEPPGEADNPLWCLFVAETTHAYFAKLRKHLDSSGRTVRLMVGISDVGPDPPRPDAALLKSGTDWRRLVTEKTVDALVVMSVNWKEADPMESTRKIYRDIIAFCAGRCQVLFPVPMYDFGKRGIPSYCRATGLSPAETAGQLLKIAWEEGADGICMECVDYNNYGPPVRARMRALLKEECRFKRAKAKP